MTSADDAVKDLAEDRVEWSLAQQFDLAARDVSEPDPELTAAVAATADEDVLAALLEELGTRCIDGDEPAARRYADHLTALSALLPADARRLVRAGVDLSLAEMCAFEDHWDEAAMRAVRAGPDLAELLPGALGDWNLVMGGCAEHDGRPADAREHWIRARDLFGLHERWSDAAGASVVLAELDNGDTERALADWREAAALFVAASRPEDAGECVTEACAVVARAIGSMGAGDEPRAATLAAAAREIAFEHGAPELAADMGSLATSFAYETPMPWEEIQPRFDALRAEYRALPGHPATTCVPLARLDMYEGTAAVSRIRMSHAEPLLTAALDVLRAEGMTDEVEMCEGALVTALRFGVPGTKIDTTHWQDKDQAAGAMMLTALDFAEDGRMAEASDAFRKASGLAREGQMSYKAVGFDAMAAMVALGAGDQEPARRSVAEIDRCLAEDAATTPLTHNRYLSYFGAFLRGDLAGHDGDRDGQLQHLAALERILLSDQAGLVAAKTALRRARLLLDGGRAREALRAALPAVLALDAVRCTLPDTQRRSRWSTAVAEGFDTAFRGAALCGDARLVAELIEVARGNAIPLPRPVDERADAVSALGELLELDPTERSDGRAGDAALAGAGAVTCGEDRTTLGLPAYLRTPWGSIALAEHLQDARRYHDPVRAGVAVDWRIREDEPWTVRGGLSR